MYKFTDRQMSLENLGLSAHVCPHCNQHLSLEDEKKILTGHLYSTKHECGRRIDGLDTIITIKPSAQKWADLLTCRQEEIWYHSTDCDPWLSRNTKPFYAHIGSRDTALDRARQVKAYDLLYTLKISPTARWSPYLVEDQNYWPEVPGREDENESRIFSEVTRYVNRYEDPGSISLLADTNVLQVVSVERVK